MKSSSLKEKEKANIKSGETADRGLLLIYPGLLTDLIGVGLVGVVIAIQVIKRKSGKAKATA